MFAHTVGDVRQLGLASPADLSGSAPHSAIAIAGACFSVEVVGGRREGLGGSVSNGQGDKDEGSGGGVAGDEEEAGLNPVLG